MFVESIKFKRDEESEWERGYYIGATDNCEKSVILDLNYQPIVRDETGCLCWDYHTDVENWIQFRYND
jgi:hypothetical protein